MKTIALNIETEGDPGLLAQLPEPDVKFGNTKDEALKKRKREEARDRQLGRAALDPWFGRVLCASLATRKPPTNGAAGELKVSTVFTADYGEAKLLGWLWKQLANGGEPARLITFNGTGFDVPFLQARSLVCKVSVPFIECNKYKVLDPNGAHCDVMQALHRLSESNPLDLARTLPFYVKQILGEDWPYADVDQSQLGTCQRDMVKNLCEWNTVRTLVLHEVLSQALA